MHELDYLRDIVVILALAVAVVTVLHRLKIPSIAGFILAGVLIGPEVLGVIGDPEQVELLAEIGVALLLFGIGLELSFDKLKRLWRPIMLGGSIQVGLSIAVTMLIAGFFDVATNTAIFLGFLMAVSSTAIVLSGLEARSEVDAPHGRLTLGILVFQDLCVVPMMLAIPILSGSGVSAGSVLFTFGKALAILAGVVIIARFLMPPILNYVASTRQRNLFTLAIVLACLGTAWVITSAGVSLALGAFLAGIVVAGSEYRHQALADLTSFRDVFSSLFFVSIGMLLAPSAILDGIVPILLILAAILIGKFLIVSATGALMRLPLRVSILAGVSLAQVGEFSFVLDRAAWGTGLLPRPLDSQVLAAAILSMLITPFAIAIGPRMAAGAGRIRVLSSLLRIRDAGEAKPSVKKMQDHVIIAGFGFAGEELARSLQDCEVPYIIVDLNVDNTRRAITSGQPAYFGDVTSPEVLELVGIDHARELVIVINDSIAVEQAIKAARTVSKDVYILARTNYFLHYDRLITAGANEVIPAEREAAVEVTARLLDRHRVAHDHVLQSITRIRSRKHD